MLLYKAAVELSQELTEPAIQELREKSMGLQYEDMFYLSSVNDRELTFCQVTSTTADVEQNLREYLQSLSIQPEQLHVEEVGIYDFADAIQAGSEAEYCPEPDEVLNRYSMAPFAFPPFREGLGEITFCEDADSQEPMQDSIAKLHSEAFREEVERIFAAPVRPFCGHPVHYEISVSNREAGGEMAGMLLTALHARGRLSASRACILRTGDRPIAPVALREVYCAQRDAAVIVEWDENPERMDEDDMKLLQKYLCRIAELAEEFRREVLTIFQVNPRHGKKLLHKAHKRHPNLITVELAEDSYNRADALKRLSELAAEQGMAAGLALQELLPEEQENFSEEELCCLFEERCDQYLRTKVYPQYAGFQPQEKRGAPEGPSAERELEELVGLSEAKTLARRAVDYAALQKLAAERGLPAAEVSMHMVFTGNPGTAKTTVARLMARILKERGILPVGELVEVGRSDLVGKYVGWTSKLVSEAFQRAKGSVLFIDEAYSLLDERGGMFGDEAINTIVREMENHRRDTVVIFAGYPGPMQKFLERNPGLKSRVPYQIHFPDYTEEELLDILNLILRKAGRAMTAEARQKAMGSIRSARAGGDFGNGRFVRKLVEQAMLAQASRLMQRPVQEITDLELKTLEAEDFQGQEQKREPRRIGFCAEEGACVRV